MVGSLVEKILITPLAKQALPLAGTMSLSFYVFQDALEQAADIVHTQSSQ